METATGSDKAVGLTVLFGLLGLAAAGAMLAGGMAHDQLLAAWGFAAAMVAGVLAVAAVHVYG